MPRRAADGSPRYGARRVRPFGHAVMYVRTANSQPIRISFRQPYWRVCNNVKVNFPNRATPVIAQQRAAERAA
jgi:hypothetical protein